MPTNANSTDAIKMFDLSSQIAGCWFNNCSVFMEGVRLSDHCYLTSHLNSPGRVFDILLFNGGGLLEFE